MIRFRAWVVGMVASLGAGMSLPAQEVPVSPATVLPSSPLAPAAATPVVTAPLADRVAAARSVKVMTAILGIKLGSELDEAHRKLDRLSAPGTPPKEEGGGEGDEDRPEHEREHGSKDKREGEEELSSRADKPKNGEAEEEGHKVLWQLAGTEYSAVYVTADDKERITSVTGILRPGKEVPFDKVGETAKAPVQDRNSILWDVLRPGQPLSRVLAKGADGKAGSIMLFVVRQRSAVLVHQNGKASGQRH